MWEEDQFHQLRESNEPKQAIYDIDEESFKNVEEGEESLNLFSTSLQLINNSLHVIGNQQYFNSKAEEEKNEEFLKHDEYKEPSPERVEVIKDTLAQEYNDLFTEYNPLN